MPGDNGFFQINDIVLNIPPEQIQIDKKSVNHMWNTLRTRSSIKSKSGFSTIRIMVSAKFTTTTRGAFGHNKLDNGLEQLRNLVSQFRVTPFCYVENQFVRNSVLGGSPEPQMVLALQQLHISKENDSTNTVDVTFFFQWFNYHAFLKDWSYKKDFFSAISTPNPAESLPWKTMYRAEQQRNDYKKIKKLDDKAISMRFQQFASLTVDQYRELERDFEALQQLQKEIALSVSKKSDQRTSANAQVIKSLVAARGRERGLLLAEETFGHITSMGPEKLTVQKVNDILDDTLAPGADNRFSLLDRAVWYPVFNNKGEAITFNDTPQAPRREVGQAEPESTMLLERSRYLALNGPSSGLIVTGLTISFENVLAQLPLIGHPYPTFQHIGSVDGVVTLSIVTTSEDSLSALTSFYNTVEDQAHKFKVIPQGQRNIRLFNGLVNMCGLHHFIPNALITGTVPGQPGTYTASLELIDNPIEPNTKESIQPGQRMQTRQDIRNMVSEILLKNLTFERQFGRSAESLKTIANTVGLYKYAPQGKTSNDPVRNQAFRTLCEEYAEEFNNLYLELFDAFDSLVPPSSEFFSLDNDDAPGIQRLQEDLFPAIRFLLPQVLRASVHFDPSTLEEARSDAARNIKNSREMGQASVAAARAIQRGDTEVQNATLAAIQTSQVDTVEELQVNRVANFINEFLQDWLHFSVAFLDKITFTDHIHLPQFKLVREMLSENIMASSGDCYPDFPLRQVVQILSTSDESAMRMATEELLTAAKRGVFGARQKGLSILLQPDFYMYNQLTDDVNSLIPFKVQQKAIEAIKASQEDATQRAGAEKSWVEQSYEAKMGPALANQIRLESANTQFDKSFWASVFESDEDEAKRKEVQEAVKAQIQASEAVFHYDDLIDVENGLACSIQTEARHDEPISLPKMDLSAFSVLGEARSPGLMVLKTRPGATLTPNEKHYAKARHRFGTNSIEFKGEPAYVPAQPRDPNKEPVWTWPTDPNNRVVTSKFDLDRISPIALKNKDTGKIVGFFNNKDGFDKKGFAEALQSGDFERKITPHKGIDISARGGSLGLPVRAAADGNITFIRDEPWDPDKAEQPRKNSGNSIELAHDGGWKTTYSHMLFEGEYAALANAKTALGTVSVAQGQIIGRVGSSGASTGAHLHFGMIDPGGLFVDPEAKLKGEARVCQGPVVGLNPTNESLFTKSIEQLEKDMHNGQGYSLLRAYPTFRLYFIESDLGERKRFGFDDFFSYSSIKDIKVIRSRKVGVDLAVISMTNVSGVLSNRKFRELADPDDPRGADGRIVTEDYNDPLLTNTADENPIASLMLKPGQQMQLRLGYNNDPDELETVLNGVITDIAFSESDDMVQIVCQSFAVELVQNQHGEVKTFGGFLSSTGRTGKILEEMLSFPEVVHFGRWEGGKANNTAYGSLRNEWNFVPSPQDDNIFAPKGRGIWGLFDSTAKYTLYHSTVWDTFQEMTLRHPSYIAYPVPYEGKWGPRMTMFFGVPDQLYFARDPSFNEDNKIEGIEKVVQDAVDTLRDSRTELDKATDPNKSAPSNVGLAAGAVGVAIAGPGLGAIAGVAAAQVTDDIQKDLDPYEQARKFWIRKKIKNFALDQGFIKPFRNYHVLTSTQHILMNNIESSGNVFNTVTLQYGDDAADVSDETAQLVFDDLQTFTLRADAAVKDEDVRELFAQYPNCVGYEMAKRYAVGLLYNTLKESYRGSIVIVGNPRIKPHDICYVFDEYSDMFGPIEVEQVVHRFSQDTGFITEITPDLIVHVNQHTTLSTSDAMGLMAEYALQKQGLASLPSLMTGAPSAVAAGATSAVGSGDLATTVGVAGSSLAAVASVAGAGAVALNYAFTPIANMFFNSSENALSQGTSNTAFGMIGTFIFKKLITRSQLAHPFRYSPLVKGGNAMVAGLPIKKTEGTFVQSIGDEIVKWAKEADEGIGLMLSDVYDKYQPNAWVGRTQGDFYDTLFAR